MLPLAVARPDEGAGAARGDVRRTFEGQHGRPLCHTAPAPAITGPAVDITGGEN